MNINKLKKEREMIIQRFKSGFKRISGIERITDVDDNLYVPLSDIERKQFEAADGDELKWKANRVHSSACLLLNTISSLRQGKTLRIKNMGDYNDYQFERKLQVLNGRGKKANIDLVLSNDQSIVFIESKFTELFFYQKKSDLSQSYFIEDKYPSKDIYQASKLLFNQSNHFDSNQLIKHTIGIYRECLENIDKYKNRKVVLMNLCWELHDTSYKYEESFNLQVRAIKEATIFTQNFRKMMKKVFKKIGIDFDFIYMNYYDFIHHQTNIGILDSDLIDYLNKRYFFFHHRKESIDNQIDYIKCHIENDLSLDDFDDYMDRFKILSIQNIYRANELIYDEKYLELADAMIIIGPNINQFPLNYNNHQVNEFLHVVSPLYVNQYTIIYLNKDYPSIKHVVIQ